MYEIFKKAFSHGVKESKKEFTTNFLNKILSDTRKIINTSLSFHTLKLRLRAIFEIQTSNPESPRIRQIDTAAVCQPCLDL
jgi:hypothetical protein